jgi:hypothetical protein
MPLTVEMKVVEASYNHGRIDESIIFIDGLGYLEYGRYLCRES